MEIIVPQLDPHEIEIERSYETWKAVPWNEEVDDMENLNEESLEQSRLEVWGIHCSVR